MSEKKNKKEYSKNLSKTSFEKQLTEEEWVDIYAKAGLIPVPVLKNSKISKKHHLVTKSNWKDIYNKYKTGQVGIKTGEEGGIFVVDIDRKKNNKYVKNGISWMRKLIKKYGIPKTPIAISGGSGVHFFFKYDEKIKNLGGWTNAVVDEDDLRRSIDLRTNGGYIVVAPSKNPDDLTKQYRWFKGYSPDKVKPISMPDWILEGILRGRERRPTIKCIINFRANRSFAKGVDCLLSEIKDITTEKYKTLEPRENSCMLWHSPWLSPKEEIIEVITKVGNALKLISPQRADGYGEWSAVCGQLASISIHYYDRGANIVERYLQEMWYLFSQQSDNYNDENNRCDETWNSFMGNQELTDPDGETTLYSYAKTDSPDKFEIWKDNYVWWKRLFQNDDGIGELLASKFRDSVKVTNVKACDSYVYNDDKRLWIKTSKDQLQTFLVKFLKKLIDDIKEVHIDYSNSLLRKCETVEDIREYKKKLQTKLKSFNKLKHNIRSCPSTSNVGSAFKRQTVVIDENFEKKLNSIPYLLPICNNEVINLRTGETREREKKDLFTFESKIPIGDSSNKELLEFLTDICYEPEARRVKRKLRYLQRLCGCFLSGSDGTSANYDRSFFIFHGIGSNGKTTLQKMLTNLLGDIAVTVQQGVFSRSNFNAQQGAATPYLMSLKGKRLIICGETRKKQNLDTTLIKNITSNETLVGRKLHHDPESFVCSAKCVLVTNFTPIIDTGDKAIIDRLKYIHFKKEYVEHRPITPEQKLKNPEIEARLYKDLLPHFFAWCIEGALEYYVNNSLKEPRFIHREGLETIYKGNNIYKYIQEKLVMDINAEIEFSRVYDDYGEWAIEHDYDPKDRNTFSIELRNFNLATKKKGKYHKTYIVGCNFV